MAAMIRAQQEKAKPQANPPSLEERASGRPAGKFAVPSSWGRVPLDFVLQREQDACPGYCSIYKNCFLTLSGIPYKQLLLLPLKPG